MRTRTWEMGQAEVQHRELLQQERWLTSLHLPLLLQESVDRYIKDSRSTRSINHPRARLVDPPQTPGLSERLAKLSTNTSHRKSTWKAQMASCLFQSTQSCLSDHRIQTEMNWCKSSYPMASIVLSTWELRLSFNLS